MKNKYIIANWKMNKTMVETKEFFNEFLPFVAKSKQNIIICPSYLSLVTAKSATANSKVLIGAQNVHFANNGIYTGEVSPTMLKEIEVNSAIIGHSSRRSFDGETNETVNKKILACIANNIMPIVCIGESKLEKQKNRTYRVLKKQLSIALTGVDKITDTFLIAYEPLWAISDGINPAPKPSSDELKKIFSGIKRVLKQLLDSESLSFVKLLYGGSVTSDDAPLILSNRTISGVLVGGASLSPSKLYAIINKIEIA